jgi:RNA polymerase sigma factor (TIGR02999 family)
MEPTEATEITRLLSRLSAGDRAVADELVAIIYKDLRRLAKHYLAQERRDHTLQPTALVHEAYMRIVQQNSVQWQNPAHFFAIAARAMRRVLIDHARGAKATKRGGTKISLESALLYSDNQCVELLALDEALTRLAQWDPRQAEIVEMKFFAGLSVEQIAQALDVSVRTVKRDWNLARAWLYGELTNSLAEPKP